MNTKICKGCQQPFQTFVEIDGIKRCIGRRAYCLDCSPYGKYKMNSKPLIDGKRQCIRCLEYKELSQFALRGKVKHYRSCCQLCESQRTLEYGRLLKQKAVNYLGGKCKKCGYNKSLRALTFHHRDPSQKEFSLAKRKCLNWDDTKKELDKCDLLCANCHAEVHDSVTFQKL